MTPKDKLVFNGQEYELIEIGHDRFRIHGEEYKDIGYDALHKIEKEIPYYECFSLRIKEEDYGLKLINEKM